MARRIGVVSHDPNWLAMFEAEAEDIAYVMGAELVAIHRIGSTSIPDIKAKPIIDLLVEVRDIEMIDTLNDAMIDLGYEPMGERGIPGRRYFRKPNKFTRTHRVHVYGIGHSDIDRYLNFRDYLIAHPGEGQAYGRLKEDLARMFPEDSHSYTEGKSEFIREIDARAKAWAAGARRN